MIDGRYSDYLRLLEVAIVRARELGLFRTAEKVHRALNEARSEQYEAAPPTPGPAVSGEIVAGTPREQTKG